MTPRTPLLCGCLLLVPASLRAQPMPGGMLPPPGEDVVLSTQTQTATAFEEPSLGVPLAPDRGPWVVGEVRFAGSRSIGAGTMLGKVRARRGTLYTPSDIAGDLKELRTLGGVLSAKADLYGMPDQPAPESYASIAVSTMLVRIVYTVEEKPLFLPGLTPKAPAAEVSVSTNAPPPAAISGVVLTPTAYRGAGRHSGPGLGFDVNAAYFIGRLYGKNSISAHQTNYIDRVGLWFLTFDGKMQVQSETTWRPAVAVGAQGTYMLRDAPQPSLQTNTLSVDVSRKTSKFMSDGYFVASKKFGPVRSSLGFMHGNAGEQTAYLTEFLSPQSLQFLSGKGEGVQATSKSVFFGSLLMLPKPSYPLGVEFIKPNGMVLNPLLLNFKLGYFLKLNFDVSYLRFQGGWDLLGTFQFRYNHFPKR